MSAYIICGILVGISAIFYTAAYTTVQPGYGDQYNNEAIAGCVMGGTSMVGGLASIGGTVIGVFIISLLQQGIMAFGLGKGQQMIITGIIVIVAVYADVSARRRKTDHKRIRQCHCHRRHSGCKVPAIMNTKSCFFFILKSPPYK